MLATVSVIVIVLDPPYFALEVVLLLCEPDPRSSSLRMSRMPLCFCIVFCDCWAGELNGQMLLRKLVIGLKAAGE